MAVAETEHVGRAAERLHVSQSPLSRQIHQLEALLGVALFERDGRRIRLTAAGKRLLPEARDLLGRADAFVRDARTPADAPARVAVGFVNAALATSLLPRALRALRERHPGLAVALRHANTPEQLALVRAGELDLALVQALPPGRDLHATRVFEQPYRLAVARGGPLAKRPLTPRLLGEVSWIALQASERTRARWYEACAAAGFTPRVSVEVADYASALALVEAGLGVAALPASATRSAPPGVVMRAFDRLDLHAELWAVRSPHAPALAEELVNLLV